jgi:hypothetical protein
MTETQHIGVLLLFAVLALAVPVLEAQIAIGLCVIIYVLRLA